MAIAAWSPVAANNTTTLGVNIAENCPAANMNNALRQAMADVAAGINFSTMGTFLASTTLANARTALGVGAVSTSATNFDLLTNAANQVPYMTGSNAWATTALTSFARTLLDDGDAATMRGTLGAIGITVAGSASSGSASITSGATTVFKINWGSHTFVAGSNSVTYQSAFTSYSVAVVSSVGDQNPTGQDNGAAVTACSTTGFTAYQVNAASVTGFFIAVGV